MYTDGSNIVSNQANHRVFFPPTYNDGLEDFYSKSDVNNSWQEASPNNANSSFQTRTYNTGAPIVASDIGNHKGKAIIPDDQAKAITQIAQQNGLACEKKSQPTKKKQIGNGCCELL